MTKLEEGIKVLVDAIGKLREIRKDHAGLSGVEARLKQARLLLEEHNEEEMIPYLRGRFDSEEAMREIFKPAIDFYMKNAPFVETSFLAEMERGLSKTEPHISARRFGEAIEQAREATREKYRKELDEKYGL